MSTPARGDQPPRLLIVVATLGLATFSLSLSAAVNSTGTTDWAVRFAILAALCAGFSLMPKQKPVTLVTAVLAAMGFLDALSSVVATGAGWALATIAVLNGAQAVAAITALLLWRKASADDATAAGYEAYVDYYNEAVQHYYSQQASAPARPESSQHGGYGQVGAVAQAARRVQHVQRTPQYGDYSDLVFPQDEYGRSASAANSQSEPQPPQGLPGSRAVQTDVRSPRGRTDESARPSSAP